MRRSILAPLAALTLAGCVTAYQPMAVDPGTGHFPTQTTLDREAVLVREPFKPEYLNLVYVRRNPEKIDKYNDFFVTSFKNMHRFNQALGQDEFQALVIRSYPAGDAPSVADLVGLSTASKKLGPILAIDVDAGFLSKTTLDSFMGRPPPFFVELKATDVVTGRVVFDIRTQRYVGGASNIDETMLFPEMNAFIDWTNGR